MQDHLQEQSGKAIDHPSSIHNLQQQQQMTPGKKRPTPQTNDEKKPRPYTEYNIFFQLERERILVELEKERNGGGDADDLCNEELSKDDDDTGIVGLMSSSKDGDDISHVDARKHRASFSSGIVLNRPSDSNDVLPRPDCFAHLQLAPLWYDSTHRLAQSKLNKSRRRHRKTHGLVGFLELTKRIAKAWSEVDSETKAYCKKVADRQLKIYKEEMRMTKKAQATTALDDLGDNVKREILGNGEGVGVGMQQQVKGQAHQQIGFFEGISDTMCRSHERKMVPPMNPSQLFSSPRSAGFAPQPFLHHEWQHHHQQYHQHGPYFHSHQMQSLGRDAHPPRPYQAPTIPPLTPTSMEHINGGSGGDVIHSALDELMYRRKLYGSRIAPSQGPRRSPGTSRRPAITTETQNANNAGENKQPQQDENDKSSPYL
ncbi:hypothetical protein ACHAXA_001358 [Cyclostephanos tholiformis]|uniref:HMG box domain-containing protein n=1 Tax=Cyclostephanos tholiformis TaxID=382380 RepID=A0ABD3RDR6_9STRA